MRFALLAGAALLAVAGSAWAGAPSDAPAGEQLVKDPDWLAAPSFEERTKAYPKAALEKRVGGETALRCKVKADGGLEACVLARETPAGLGFGEAALVLADRFRMKPDAIPRPAPGDAAPTVLLPIRWAIVDQPDWVRLPSGDELSGLYPDGARAWGMPGSAKIQCEVETDGTLANCFTMFEVPEGSGFGKAALGAARFFRMKPATLDGKPVGGGMVEIPIHWQVTGGGDTAQVGDGSMLIVAKPPGMKQSKYVEIDCATAASQKQKCLAIPASWRAQPSSSQVWEVLNRGHLMVGVNWLSCNVGDDGGLRDCNARSGAAPDREAAMRELAAGLKAAPGADDFSTQGQLVFVKFDWEQLRRAAKPAPKARR